VGNFQRYWAKSPTIKPIANAEEPVRQVPQHAQSVQRTESEAFARGLGIEKADRLIIRGNVELRLGTSR